MRILVISDIHFGVTESSINNENIRKLLINCIKDNLPINRIILLGDIFDLDLARFGDALDGNDNSIIGFRQFITELIGNGVQADKWTYIPGNHDYDLFDIPARNEGMKRRFSKKSGDKIIYWPPQTWEGWNIAPNVFKNTIEVQYPHRWEQINGKYILLTHGHYFDPSQTFGYKIEKVNKKDGIPIEKFFTRSAQYQGLARLVSYQGRSILVVGGLYRTGELMKSFFKKVIKYGSIGLYRGKPLNKHLKNAAAAYVSCFGPLGRPKTGPVVPDALIFGHTHEEGISYVNKETAMKYGIEKGFTLVNDGGFIRGSGGSKIVGSFAVIEAKKEKCCIKLFVLKTDDSSGPKADMVQQCVI